MNKRVTIQEAIKANEHSRVRRLNYSCNYSWYKVGELHNSKLPICVEDILAEWEIEARTLEMYVNIYDDGTKKMFETQEQAAKSIDNDFIRCVKMREVVE